MEFYCKNPIIHKVRHFGSKKTKICDEVVGIPDYCILKECRGYLAGLGVGVVLFPGVLETQARQSFRSEVHTWSDNMAIYGYQKIYNEKYLIENCCFR